MPKDRRLATVCALFFLSGAAGLIYEVVWSRLFKDVFGVTAYAVAAVLATYLGGLALGSWALGRAADRPSDPLRLYGFLEIGVAATALAGLPAIHLFDPLHAAAAARLAPGSPALACLRVVLASMIILPPTFLMGGTLPAMTKVFVERREGLGRQVSMIYALNTAGAVAGSLAAGFLFIRWLGVHPTLWLAVAANLAVGTLSLALAARRPVAAAAPAPEPERPQGARAPRLLLALALAGVASLSLEVIWTRVMVLVVGSSTHAFATMLAAFLVGIALGSFLSRLFVDRLRNPRLAFGWVQVAIAASTLATIPLMGALVSSAQRWLLGLELHWAAVLLGRFGIAFLILIVPTTLMGMAFPLAGKIGVRSVQGLGGELGAIYAANTLGNIAGALLGGFVLLPAVGMQRGIVFVTSLNLASAAWGFLPGAAERTGRRSLLRTAGVAATFAVCLGLLAFWRPRPFVSVEESEGDRVLFYQEGLVSTVKVFQRADDARQIVMLVDGIRIGQSSAGIDNKQQVLAHVPFLLRPRGAIKKVLTIGLGTGIVTGEVARHPGVARVDCVELSPSVIEGARFFAAFNGDVLESPSVRVIADDGINFLKRGSERYDAIVSDGKSRLGQAGNAPFYSQDYYRSAREHLADGGLMIQWMPLEEVPEDLRTIVRTFISAFPRAYLWMGHSSLFLVGMQEQLLLDLDHIQDVLDAKETAGLRRYGWRSATDIAALLVADPASAKDWLSHEGTINSTEHPVLEFSSPRELAMPAPARIAANVAALEQTRRATLQHMRFAGPDAAELDASSRAMDRLLEALRAMNGGSAEAVALLEKAAADAPEGSEIRFSAAASMLGLGEECELRGDDALALRLYRSATNAWPESVAGRVSLAAALSRQGAVPEAAAHLHEALRLNPDSGAAHRLLARLVQAGDSAAALPHFQEALRIGPGLADVHYDFGTALEAVGRRTEALAEFREAMRLQPGWAAPMADAALLLALDPDPALRNSAEAIDLATRALKLTGTRNQDALEILAASYASAGRYDEAAAVQQQAVDLAVASGNRERTVQAEGALDHYRQGLSHR
jgi:spermidine synthase